MDYRAKHIKETMQHVPGYGNYDMYEKFFDKTGIDIEQVMNDLSLRDENESLSDSDVEKIKEYKAFLFTEQIKVDPEEEIMEEDVIKEELYSGLFDAN